MNPPARSDSRATLSLIAGCVVASGVSLVVVKYVSVPYVWLGVSWTLLLVWSATVVRAVIGRVILVCAATFVGTLTLAEAYLWAVWLPPPKEVMSPPNFYPADTVLGWRLRSGKTRAMLQAGDQVIYTHTYTIDSAGWRVLPPDSPGSGRGCVLLLVDSFIFGTGVDDDQTLPSLLRRSASRHFQIVSLSRPGFGAEHMLTELEHGVIAGLPCRPTIVIYQAIIDHVSRAAGIPSFSRRGPHYELQPDGTLQYLGLGWPTLTVSPGGTWAHRQLMKSRLYNALFARQAFPTERDFQRYFAILARFRMLLERQYPGVAFHVIAWNPLGPYARFSQSFLTGLQMHVPNFHLISRILPGYLDDPLVYQVHTTDDHPNPFANALLAKYVLQCVLEKPAHNGSASGFCDE